jgi:hypothetical protein
MLFSSKTVDNYSFINSRNATILKKFTTKLHINSVIPFPDISINAPRKYCLIGDLSMTELLPEVMP